MERQARRRVMEAIETRPREQSVELWKENRLDQQYSLTVKEISVHFRASHFYSDWKMSRVFYLRKALTLFIGDRDAGLNSVWDVERDGYLISAIEDEILRQERG